MLIKLTNLQSQISSLASSSNNIKEEDKIKLDSLRTYRDLILKKMRKIKR